jgi:hypothetical protein
MVHFQTKNPNLGNFGRVLKRKKLVYYTAVWSILRPFCIFVAVGCILWSFIMFFPFWYVVARELWQPCREPSDEEIIRAAAAAAALEGHLTRH